MATLSPNRVLIGKSGAGRYDFKHNTEAEIDLVDADFDVDIACSEGKFDLSKRVGLGNISESRSYLRTIEAINRAQTPQSVGAALSGLLRDRGVVSGFDKGDFDMERVREVARTLTDLFTKYPSVNADISIGQCQPGISAEALGYRYRDEESYFKKEMVISRIKMSTASNVEADFEKCKGNGWFHVVNDDVTPMQYVVTHEFGHLIDYDSDRTVSTHDVRKAYIDKLDFVNPYVQEAPHIDANTSRYGKSCREELLAEAFADTECNGDQAFEYSKALHAELVGAIK